MVMEYNLTIQDVIDELAKRKISAHIKTLQRRAKDGLIPCPYRKSGGRGKGMVVLYPDDTPAEYYAAEKVKEMFKLSYSEIKKIREIALGLNLQEIFEYIFEIQQYFLAYFWLCCKAEYEGTLQEFPQIEVSRWARGSIGWRERNIHLELKTPEKTYYADISDFNDPVKTDLWWKLLDRIQRF